jgi:hypothetical protein
MKDVQSEKTIYNINENGNRQDCQYNGYIMQEPQDSFKPTMPFAPKSVTDL